MPYGFNSVLDLHFIRPVVLEDVEQANSRI